MKCNGSRFGTSRVRIRRIPTLLLVVLASCSGPTESAEMQLPIERVVVDGPRDLSVEVLTSPCDTQLRVTVDENSDRIRIHASALRQRGDCDDLGVLETVHLKLESDVDDRPIETS